MEQDRKLRINVYIMPKWFGKLPEPLRQHLLPFVMMFGRKIKDDMMVVEEENDEEDDFDGGSS